MPPVLLALLALAVILPTIAFGFLPKARGHLRHALARIRGTTIAQARPGLVKVRGKVACLGEPLRAPLSGRRCAVFDLTIEQDGELAATTGTLLHEVRGQDFLLRDGVGKALVRFPPLPSLWLECRKQTMDAIDGDTLRPDLEGYLVARRGPLAGLGLSRVGLHAHEGILAPGIDVVVAGEGVWEPDPAPEPGVDAASAYRDAPRRLVITAPAGGKLMITDDPEAFKS